jgi:hypothetical protein
MSMSSKKRKARTSTVRRHSEQPAPVPRPQGELQMVTVVEMSPEDYPGEIAGSYGEACAALGVTSVESGYGLVLDQDEAGARWTRVTTDVDGIRSVQAIWNTDIECGYEPPPETVSATLPGWPVDRSLGLAGLPRPHDPPGALRGQEWPAQVPRRRAVADGIARELADTGHWDAARYAELQRSRAWELGDTELKPVLPRLIDLRRPLGPGDQAQAAVDRALSEAWELADVPKPPPGAVRTRKSWPSGLVIRATGSDWTLVARTGPPPLLILLADDAPRRVLDVSGVDQASALLDALTAAAARSAGS